MPHSVIIEDTRGVPSLSHVHPAAFLSKEEGWEGVIRLGMCAKLCVRIFVRPPLTIKHDPACAPRGGACVWMQEFSVRRGIPGYASSRERHYRGGAPRARFESTGLRQSSVRQKIEILLTYRCVKLILQNNYDIFYFFFFFSITRVKLICKMMMRHLMTFISIESIIRR